MPIDPKTGLVTSKLPDPPSPPTDEPRKLGGVKEKILKHLKKGK